METCPTCDAHLRIDGKVIECSRFPKCSWVMSLHEWATELIMEDNGSCPDCGAKVVEKQNKTTKNNFIGCSTFPKCKWTRSVKYFDNISNQPTQYDDDPIDLRDYDNDWEWHNETGLDLEDTF